MGTMRIRRLARIALLLILIAGTALLTQEATQLLAVNAVIWAIGNGGGCTLAECVNEISTNLLAKAGSIKAKSTLIATDQDLVLWNTPYGLFWSPKANA